MFWYESFNKFWSFLHNTLPSLKESIQWKLCKPLHCTELARPKKKKPTKQRWKTCKRDIEVLHTDWIFHPSCSHFSSKHFGTSSVLNTWPTALPEERCLCVTHPGFKICLCQHQLFLVFCWSYIGEDSTQSSNTLENLAVRDFFRSKQKSIPFYRAGIIWQ